MSIEILLLLAGFQISFEIEQYFFRFKNFSGSYSDDSLFIAKGGHEKEIYVPGN